MRFAISFALYGAIVFWIFQNHPDHAIALCLHSAFGFVLSGAFDAARIIVSKTNIKRALTIFFVGVFVRMAAVGIYGMLHMFAGTIISASALISFAGSIVASLLFSVAWEAGWQIYSLRK